MRVRKRKGAEEHLENNPNYVILTPEESKGHWKEVFGNNNPIHIEVGSGKGGFVTGMAQKILILITLESIFNSLSLVMHWIRYWNQVFLM